METAHDDRWLWVVVFPSPLNEVGERLCRVLRVQLVGCSPTHSQKYHSPLGGVVDTIRIEVEGQLLGKDVPLLCGAGELG